MTPTGDGHEYDDEDNSEEKYELFENMSSKNVRLDYSALMKGETSDGRHGNGNNSDYQRGCGQETNWQN